MFPTDVGAWRRRSEFTRLGRDRQPWFFIDLGALSKASERPSASTAMCDKLRLR